eukprot:COSAG03_NODE_282_length_9474_cov_2.398720_5_plen_31_part_00
MIIIIDWSRHGSNSYMIASPHGPIDSLFTA